MDTPYFVQKHKDVLSQKGLKIPFLQIGCIPSHYNSTQVEP